MWVHCASKQLKYKSCTCDFLLYQSVTRSEIWRPLLTNTSRFFSCEMNELILMKILHCEKHIQPWRKYWRIYNDMKRFKITRFILVHYKSVTTEPWLWSCGSNMSTASHCMATVAKCRYIEQHPRQTRPYHLREPQPPYSVVFHLCTTFTV